jgi:CRP-like cAMP-binding protein
MGDDGGRSEPALIATLRRVPLFNELSEDELASLAERVTVHEYDAAAIVFSEGDVCRELYVVKDGAVKVLKIALSGRHQLIAMERAGNTLSEIPVFDGGRYPATAQAAERTSLLRLEADHFRAICLQQPALAMKVIKVLGHRLRHMGRLIEDLSFSTVRGRLVAHLIRLADENGRQIDGGTGFELTENNEELAGRLGTVRELISRTLGRLHGEGWIEMRRRLVVIRDLEGLRREIAEV